MFGLFKGNEKKLEQAAANIATLLNTCFFSIRVSNNGNLPMEFHTDKYILGYIYGVTGAGAYAVGIQKPADKGRLIMNVFKLFFPEDSDEVVAECTKLANSKEQKFMEGTNNGIDESAIIYKAIMSGDEEAVKGSIGTLKTLENHLNENYN